MRRADVLALAARVEALTGPDQETDAEIACTVKFRQLRPSRPDDFDGEYGYNPGYLKCEHGFLMADAYTASLDAAASLVPAGWAWTLYGGDRADETATAYCVPRGAALPWPEWVTDIDAATPALALTAAALRAIAEGMSDAG